MSAELPPDAPIPRLCHLVKWVDFDGYGFNLHAEKSRTGQFIGKVDEDSPAQHAGLQEGDRIIEVNGVNIANENHRQVVERIKSVSNETKLLVVDEEADQWYKERKVVVKSTLPNVLLVKTPVPRPYKEPPCYENVVPPNGVGNGVHEGKRSPETIKHEKDSKQNGSQLPIQSNGTTEKKEGSKQNGTATPPPVTPPANHSKSTPESKEESKQNGTTTPPQVTPPPSVRSNGTQEKKEASHSRSSTPLDVSIPDSPHSSRSTSSLGAGSTGNPVTPLEDGVLNLNMSASEMRQMLANRRKKDPKKEQMDIRQKYEIIQQM